MEPRSAPPRIFALRVIDKIRTREENPAVSITTTMNIARWMSWEGGVDLIATTQQNLAGPNVIVHVGRMVHTPFGSCPAGMILWQPDPSAPPALMGFFATDENIGRYFGPNLFYGTPFESAPVLPASVQVDFQRDYGSARIEITGFVFETHIYELSEPELVNRPPGSMSPFHTQGVERVPAAAALRVNGQDIGLASITGSVVAPCGVYAR